MLASLCSASKNISSVNPSYQKINDLPETLKDQSAVTSLQATVGVAGAPPIGSNASDLAQADWRRESQMANVTAPPRTMHSPFPGLGASNYPIPAETAAEGDCEARVNSEGRDEG